jgi:hypothetical protein
MCSSSDHQQPQWNPQVPSPPQRGHQAAIHDQ